MHINIHRLIKRDLSSSIYHLVLRTVKTCFVQSYGFLPFRFHTDHIDPCRLQAHGFLSCCTSLGRLIALSTDAAFGIAVKICLRPLGCFFRAIGSMAGTSMTSWEWLEHPNYGDDCGFMTLVIPVIPVIPHLSRLMEVTRSLVEENIEVLPVNFPARVVFDGICYRLTTHPPQKKEPISIRPWFVESFQGLKTSQQVFELLVSVGKLR